MRLSRCLEESFSDTYTQRRQSEAYKQLQANLFASNLSRVFEKLLSLQTWDCLEENISLTPSLTNELQTRGINRPNSSADNEQT